MSGMMVLGWLFFSIAAGMFAHIRRNRNGIGWFFVAIFFTPLVAFVLLAILQVKEISAAPTASVAVPVAVPGGRIDKRGRFGSR
jgi:hypothetical protein